MIPAYSPQARGRSERNFSTWQGRLPQELLIARDPKLVKGCASCLVSITSLVQAGASRSRSRARYGVHILPASPPNSRTMVFTQRYELNIPARLRCGWMSRGDRGHPQLDSASTSGPPAALNTEGPKNQNPRPSAQTARDKDGVPGLLSFTSWAATPAAQDLRGGSTQRAGRSVHRYVR